MSTKQRLHPFVDAFVHSDKTIREILEKREAFAGPLFDAMRSCVDVVRGELPHKDAINKAHGVDVEGEDPYVRVVFLWLWATVSRLAGRFVEGSALVLRARNLLDAGAPPELDGFLLEVEAEMARAIGNQAKADAIYRRIVSGVPEDSAKRLIFLLDYAFFLAPLWQEPEIDADLEKLAQANPKRYAPMVGLRRLSHYIEIGNFEKARSSLAIAEQDESIRTAQAWLLAFSRQIIELMETGQPAEPESGKSHIVAALLLAGKPEEALGLIRERLIRDLDIYLSQPAFSAFNLVRAELACGHGEAARRIMEVRRRRGNVHPMDDFFLARAELLCGNREQAAGLFARALSTFEKHSARGRLEFELKMSCELKPVDMLRLTRGPVSVGKALPASRPAPTAAASQAESGGVARLIGPSAAMQAVRQTVRRCASLEAPVLITGETGTGKELVARALHEESARRPEAFLAVNCGAIVETLLETELFGHERGAFTGAARAHRGIFEQAGSGTVLLDEIGDVSPRLQVALLRVLEAGEVRPVGADRARKVACRILAATNADLEALAGRGTFRNDLLFRLRRMEIRIPPLRERREDILPLADHFFGEERTDSRRATLSPELKAELLRRDWPGNVRELRNEVEHMRLLCSEKLAYDVTDLRAPTAPAGSRQPATDGQAERNRSLTDDSREESPAARVARVLTSSRSPLRRLDRLREAFRHSPTLTRQEVIGILGISHATATHDLAVLCREGLIEKVQPTRSPRTHYFRLRSS